MSFLILGCEQNFQQVESCSIQGFNFNVKHITCKEKLIVNTIDFSNGFSRSLIQGKINIDQVDYPFSVVLDSTQVVDYTFDFIGVDSNNYTCSYKRNSSDVIELDWTNGKKRIFLRKKLTSVR